MNSSTQHLSKTEQVWLNSFISGYTRGLSKGQSLELADEILYEFETKFPVNDNVRKDSVHYEKEVLDKMHGEYK